ncbi:MAG: peptide-methionine (R)-S-oxide reductase MsrB [Methanospirillum sp.]|nr:peptide-methionine (R)-S-oxide reductase MsrB [Methanospirillum sp.]
METGDQVPIYSVRERKTIAKSRCLLSDSEWRERLTPAQYAVARAHGTEPAFANEYHSNRRRGLYRCVCCGTDLFISADKFDSGTGWPSFTRPVAGTNVIEVPDHSLGIKRIEVRCRRCNAHLGHVFSDGPPPEGRRYCMNSASLIFVEDEP